MRISLILLIGLACFAVIPSAWAAQNVAATRHNLSTTGPGTVKSATVSRVCVFCHTPHNSNPDAPLWNRPDTAAASFTPYDSSTLVAPTPGQPTGKSRLCLSCHDGTVALGNLAIPPAGNDMSATFLTGADRGFLDTDLRDDHPISFAYDAALFGANPELHNPASIGLPLEGGDQLQCTTCHDPHEADLKPFLRVETANGTLCETCHQKSGWSGSTHQTSGAAITAADLPWRRAEWVATTVAGNSCLNCHTPHNANPDNPARLVARSPVQADGVPCLDCHDGSPAPNMAADFGGVSTHPVGSPTYAGLHDATSVESPATMPLHVECADCHNPHTVTSGALPMVSFNPADPLNGAIHSTPPLANSLIDTVTGVDINGNATATVTNQYELCFKCHGVAANTCGTGRCGAPKTHGMVRADMTNGIPNGGGTPVNKNIRERVVPAAGPLSYHPIVSNNAAATAAEVPSLRTDIPLNTTTSLIYCTDCHNSNQSAAAGNAGPNGPHGSSVEGLLAQNYVLDINSTASDTASYALCYKCHDELTIKSAASFSKHDAHIGNRRGSCMKCHDPHGSYQATRLINFLWYSDAQIVIDCVRGKGQQSNICDPTGFPEPKWEDTGTFTGSCTLSCHGTGHSGKTY